MAKGPKDSKAKKSDPNAPTKKKDKIDPNAPTKKDNGIKIDAPVQLTNELKVDKIGEYNPDFKLADLIKCLIKPEFPVRSMRIESSTTRELLARTLSNYTAQAKSQTSALLELKAPIRICGDIHGHYIDLLRIFHACGSPTKETYLFLGNYVDRGLHSLEVIVLLFALKLAFPNKIHLLRGNHELKDINRNYGFYADIKQRFKSEKEYNIFEQLYLDFNHVFSFMPLAAIVSGRILCMHGGISPHLKSLDDIRNIPLPLKDEESNPLACDLLWADPEKGANGFEPNKIRAISHIFGKKEVDDLCKRLDIDLIVRAHQVVEYGYAFFADRHLVTVFSVSRFDENLYNYAAVVNVDENLEISFVQFKPEEFEKHRDSMDGDVTKEQTTANIN